MGQLHEQEQFNDLDIMFFVDFPRKASDAAFNDIRKTVLSCLREYLPFEANKREIPQEVMASAYVGKMFRVPKDNANGVFGLESACMPPKLDVKLADCCVAVCLLFCLPLGIKDVQLK